MVALSARFSACLKDIHAAIRDVEGYLSKVEIDFLAVLGACPTAPGQILEIGSFRGRSTIVLARAAAIGDAAQVAAVDPLPDRLADSQGRSARAALEANLCRAGVRERVDVHQMLSQELQPSWNQPLRLLWIDAEHSYAAALRDFTMFAPFLTDGAIVAFHDVLHPFGCLRAYREGVVDSPHFGPVGLVGSIGWGQYFADPARCESSARHKERLSRQLVSLERYDPQTVRRNRLTRLMYRLQRWRVPHGAMAPQRWLTSIAGN